MPLLRVSVLARLFAISNCVTLIDHIEHAGALTICLNSSVTSMLICDGRHVTINVMRGTSLHISTTRRHQGRIIDLFQMQDASDVLIILLSDLHHLGRLGRLLFKLLLCLLHLFLFLGDPFVKLQVLALEGSR